jgi:sec-independent protein translocase protein TatB
MFDVGFQELVLIGVVALLVVGPERLPRLARTAGLWLGRARRVLGSVKAEIDRELKADELKEILRKQAASNPLQTILEETESLASHPFAGAGSSHTDARTRDASVARAQLPAQAESASAPVQPLREPATQPGVGPGPGPAPHT